MPRTKINQAQIAPFEYLVYVDSLVDFPSPVGNVITLDEYTTYHITLDLDLEGHRLVCTGPTALRGGTDLTSKITSTLSDGEVLITAADSLYLANLSLSTNSTAVLFDINGVGKVKPHVELEDINLLQGTIGTLSNLYDFTWKGGGADQISGGLILSGNFNHVTIEDVDIEELESGVVGLTLDASLVVTERFNMRYSIFEVEPGGVGISISSLISIPPEALEINFTRFEGAGTYLTGITESDNRVRFRECVGITNSASQAQYEWEANATATSFTSSGVFVKAQGTSNPNVNNKCFTHSDNRATYTGAIIRNFRILAISSLTGTSNNVAMLAVYKNGVKASVKQESTLNSSGRSENICVSCNIVLDPNDYVEVWIANKNSTSDITVENLQVDVYATGG